MEITKEYTKMGNEVTVFSRNTGNDPTHDEWNGVKVHRPRLMNLSDVLSVISPADVQRWDAGGQQFFTETLAL